MNLVERAKGVILNPKGEWSAIEAEPTSALDLYRNYIMILAAIPAIANFLGNWLFGFSRGQLGTVHTSFLGGLGRAVLQYSLTLPLIYLVALAISHLAPSFEGRKNDLNALKLVAYSYMPAWLAGAFGLIPGLRWLDVLGLYGLYVFYLGVPRMMKCREDYADVFTAAALALGIVAAALHAGIVHLIAPWSSISA